VARRVRRRAAAVLLRLAGERWACGVGRADAGGVSTVAECTVSSARASGRSRGGGDVSGAVAARALGARGGELAAESRLGCVDGAAAPQSSG
jgi:hypothetical protein